ncbi:hypothetical protein CBER1_09369 [Cercospora berteroae]|uniref:F-box domain-containing protein n=1 Tax=Cercospora berteroae TaxID=357750 RepID=A0A2S6BWP7_9PEZI|nr:hypothetical protein CBER1_09369 [Cercospora berteroae]
MGNKRKAEAPPEGSRRSERLQTVKRQKVADEDTASHLTSTKPKRFRRPRQRKSCDLLNLPGEIRNKIYRYALIEAKPIEVMRKGPGEPSLLRVCNRIRREARSIYYAENEFEVHLEDFNGEALVPFKNQYSCFSNWQNGQRRGVNITNLMKGKPNWENLVAWAKADRFRTAFWPDISRAYCPTHQVAASVFRIVDSVDGLPWYEVEVALEAMREVLDGLPSLWAEYPDWF